MLRNDWLTSAPLPAHGQLFALALCRESTEKTLEERFYELMEAGGGPGKEAA